MHAGMTPDGVKAFQPTGFSDHFYLIATDSKGEQLRVDTPGQRYELGGGAGALQVVGMADTGRLQAQYDDCYLEDYDNYLDIILDASSKAAAEALATVQAFQAEEGYAPLYNPGKTAACACCCCWDLFWNPDCGCFGISSAS